MRTFRVVQEPYGWALRLEERTTGLFRSRLQAVERAYWLCSQLQLHGEPVRVLVDGVR